MLCANVGQAGYLLEVKREKRTRKEKNKEKQKGSTSRKRERGTRKAKGPRGRRSGTKRDKGGKQKEEPETARNRRSGNGQEMDSLIIVTPQFELLTSMSSMSKVSHCLASMS